MPENKPYINQLNLHNTKSTIKRQSKTKSDSGCIIKAHNNPITPKPHHRKQILKLQLKIKKKIYHYISKQNNEKGLFLFTSTTERREDEEAPHINMDKNFVFVRFERLGRDLKWLLPEPILILNPTTPFSSC